MDTNNVFGMEPFSKREDKKTVEYFVAIPGGNNTALVKGIDFSKEEMKIINDKIMQSDPLIEQVGFLNQTENELVMAGGEFCGNATRSSAAYYLNGQAGEMKVKLNSKDIVNAGVNDKNEAWCEIPLYFGDDMVVKLEEGIYKVKMQGMVTVVIKSDAAEKYLQDKENIKDNAKKIMQKYNLMDNEAVGVMFLEEKENRVSMNPIVWVNSIDTCFYETACGSGTVATAIVDSYIKGEGQSMSVIQPSGYSINAEITMEENKVQKAVISGMVNMDDSKKYIEI